MAGQKNNVKRLEKSPYHLLKRAAQYAANIYTADVGKSGLTQRQYTVLTAVDGNDGVSQTDLVKSTGIDRSTLADLISRLAAQGYLQRKRCKTDARINNVRLTAAGRKVLQTVQPGAANVDKQLLSVIPVAKRKDFIEMLGLLAARVDESEATGIKGSRAPNKPRAKKAPRRKAQKSK